MKWFKRKPKLTKKCEVTFDGVPLSCLTTIQMDSCAYGKLMDSIDTTGCAGFSMEPLYNDIKDRPMGWMAPCESIMPRTYRDE